MYAKFLALDDFINTNYDRLSKEQYNFLTEILNILVAQILED